MVEPTYLPGEQPLRAFRPHPLSFLGEHLSALIPALWAGVFAFIVRTAWWAKVPWRWAPVQSLPHPPETLAGYFLLLGGLVAIGSWVATVRIRWILVIQLVVAALVAIAASWGSGDFATRAPVVLALLSLPLVAFAELGRRRHLYVITNLRIIITGGGWASKERQIRWESITDLDATQGPLGRAFGFGTIIPITSSGFGLGSDSSQASIAAGGGGSRGFLGVAAGGGRSLQTGRARSFHQLTGARPFAEIKAVLEQQLHAGSQATMMQQQIDLQRQTLAALTAVQAQTQAAPHTLRDVTAKGRVVTVTRPQDPVKPRAADPAPAGKPPQAPGSP